VVAAVVAGVWGLEVVEVEVEVWRTGGSWILEVGRFGSGSTWDVVG
jgi:hypothetical protein